MVQWGGAHVWKVGGEKGKLFAVAGWGEQDGGNPNITFKCSDLSFEILKEQRGMRPAPYLASRGLKWIQITDHGALSDADLKAYLLQSYQLAARNLTRKARIAWGIGD